MMRKIKNQAFEVEQVNRLTTRCSVSESWNNWTIQRFAQCIQFTFVCPEIESAVKKGGKADTDW